MFRNIYGLDLGTYEIKIYDKRRDRIRSAKNVIAIRDEKDIFAVLALGVELLESTG